MGRVAFAAVLVGSVVGLALVSAPGRASLYSPDDPLASLQVGPDGLGQALPLDEFKRRLAVLKNQLNPELKDNKDRQRVLARIATRQNLRGRPRAETVALAVDLLRTGKLDEAAGLLAAERGGFLPNLTLAHIRAAGSTDRDDRGWAAATEHLAIANEERAPATIPGLTPAQWAWQQKINQGPLAELFKSRWQEARHHARQRLDPENEQPDPVFPVRFVNAAGVYEPGVLAPAEKANLPPDAIATVQQLLLWSPTDARLYWLLGELYAATGQLRAAETVFNDLVDTGWKYGNRKAVQEHRAAMRAAVAALPPPVDPTDVPLTRPAAPGPEPEPKPDGAISMKTVWVYFAVVGAVGAFALVRALTRRR